MTKYFLILFLLFNYSLSSEEKPNTFQVTNLESPVSLDSNENQDSAWYVFTGELSESEIKKQSLAPFDKSLWKTVKVPGNIAKEAPEFQGKKNILLAKWIRMPKDNQGNISIRLGVINDRDKFYWNGVKIAETGKWDAHEPQSYDRIRLYPIPNQLINYGETNLIMVHIQPYFDYTVGVEQDSTSLGKSSQMMKKFYFEEFTKLLFLVVYLTVGGYFLFLFIRRRRESENLFFALFSIGLVFYNLLRNQIKYEFGIPFLYMKKVEYMILLTLIPFMFHFIRKLFDFKYLLLFKIIDGLQICFFLFFLITSNIEINNWMMNKIIQPTWIFYVVIILYYLLKKTREKDKQAGLILIGMLVVLVASLLDILSTRGIFVFPRILGYAFLAFIVSLATILANSFVKLNEEVEDLNKNLEKKVADRTEALNSTLTQVNLLKEQQDGDYFLTSLLINPLARNDNKSKIVKTSFFTRQKKHFEFRGRKTEIGGDICISNNIKLGDKLYTVFINGDAMGKSIQGAGGALVLGVVFHAVLARTKVSEQDNTSPELWLRDLFLELQMTFESFDGSMLTSIALGLVEEDSGYLYYINAEHPWTILYRDGKASFIENELWLRKLGFPKNDQNFSIKTYQLYAGDILICGSDGRDDIALPGTEQSGNRIINEDETLILKWIESSHANLDDIVKQIESFGDITDDLTLIKISFDGKSKPQFDEDSLNKFTIAKNLSRKEDFREAKTILLNLLNHYPEHHSIYQLLGKIYFREKDWKNATKYLETAVNIRPDREELFLMLTLTYSKNDHYQKAISWAERLKVRNPKHIKNNINLIFLYAKTENKSKAMNLLKVSLKDQPENRDLQRLEKKLS